MNHANPEYKPSLITYQSTPNIYSNCMVILLRIFTFRSKYSWQSLALFLWPQQALSSFTCFGLMKCSDLATIHCTPSLYGGVVSDPSYRKMSILTSTCPRRDVFLMVKLEASNRWSKVRSLTNGMSSHFFIGNWLQNWFRKSFDGFIFFKIVD